MVKTYQWTKGDRMGSVVKSIGESFIEDNIEYIVFNDGSMVNSALMGEFLIEIPSEKEAMLMLDLAPEPMKRVERKKAETAPQTNYVQTVELSPIERLLSDCKKSQTEFDVKITVQLPSLDLIKVLGDSYENGEEQVLDFLAASIKFEDVKDSITSAIRENVYKSKKTTKKSQKDGEV